MGGLRIDFKDGYAVIDYLTFKELLQFQKYQTLMQNKVYDYPEMKDLLKLFKPKISAHLKSGKPLRLERISLDAFRVLTLLVLHISVPDHAETITVVCDGEKVNLDKQMKLDEFNLTNPYSDISELSEDELKQLEEIEALPDKVPCETVIRKEVTLSDLRDDVEYMVRSVPIIKTKLAKHVHRVKVGDYIALESITRDPCLEEVITFSGSEDFDPLTLYPLTDYLDGETLDCNRLKEDGASILFEALYLALYISRFPRVSSIVKAYDKILNANQKDVLKLDKEIVEKYMIKDTEIDLKCPSCGKVHKRIINLSNFKLIPD